MSSEYGDTSYDSVEDSQTSGYDGEDSAETGDTGGFEPEYDDKGNPEPVPYDRFRESRSQLKDARSMNESLQRQIYELQENNRRQSEYNQYAYQEMQRLQESSSSTEASVDEYVDPLEEKYTQLEAQNRELASRQEQLIIDQSRRQLENDIAVAQRRYPSMNPLDVCNVIIENPNASVMALAKRSHEAAERKYNERLRRDGYAPKPRKLSRGQNRMPVAKDYGDDLEGAEAAAIEFLSNS
tara:strand:- start:3486 stop:4205 length:720 start_codon:yes stop_codon:yes gene_type:complete